MKKVREFLASPAVTLAAFAAAVVLLLTASIGGARAALAYYSETYSTRVQMYDIGVTLQENGKSVSWRNYDANAADGSWDDSTGILLSQMVPEGENFKIGKKYTEELNVKNTGTINQYVRVSVYRYWMDADGNKLPQLSPEFIGLDLAGEDSGWLVDEAASTPERTVLYYNKLLESGSESPLFANSLTVSPRAAEEVTQESTTQDGYTTIRTTYDYNGAQFHVEAKVDAVQEHNAQDAIWSAWGRKVTVNNGSLSLD